LILSSKFLVFENNAKMTPTTLVGLKRKYYVVRILYMTLREKEMD